MVTAYTSAPAQTIRSDCRRDLPTEFAFHPVPLPSHGAGAVTNFVFGRLFDRVGFPVAAAAFLLGALFAPFVFLGRLSLVIVGMVLWGVGMGAQNSLLKAMLSSAISAKKRSTGFGLFYTFFGVAWFLGSGAMGFLYERSLIILVVFSVVIQLAAIPVFFLGTDRARVHT